FLQLLSAAFGLRPVLLEDLEHLIDDAVVSDDDPELAALVELDAAKALTAEKRALAVADDRADVEALARVLLARDVPLRLDLADHAHVDAFAPLLHQNLQHRIVAHLGIVDEQLPARAAEKPRELVARVFRADDEPVVPGRVRQAVEVGREELLRLRHELSILRHDAEAPALLHVEAGEVEAVDVEDLAVDDDHLAVITHEVVGGGRHRPSGLEQLHLELAKTFGAATILMGGERADAHPARHGSLERAADLGAVEAEDQNVNVLLGLLDGRDDRRNSGVGLNN